MQGKLCFCPGCVRLDVRGRVYVAVERHRVMSFRVRAAEGRLNDPIPLSTQPPPPPFQQPSVATGGTDEVRGQNHRPIGPHIFLWAS